VFNVLGVSGFGDDEIPANGNGDELEQPLIDLKETYQNLTARNARRQATTTRRQALDMALNLFNGGTCVASAARRRRCTGRFASKLRKLTQQMDDVPEDLQSLDDTLADTYFCNFSLFQSIPDSWRSSSCSR